MIKIEGLKKRYGSFSLDCTMKVGRDRITGLVGRNGAGKTTVFRCILGLAEPDGGEIELFSGEHLNDTEMKKKTGVVFAEAGFSRYLTIEKIASVLDSAYEKFSRETFLERCREAGLVCNKRLKEFSTGMNAKLKFIIATSYDAELLILDEPTAGLDVIAREEMLDMLRKFMENGNRSVLISSHIAGDLENLCDDIYMIEDGKIIFHEDTDRILSDYAVLKVSEEQFRDMDKSYIVRIRKENFGYRILTDEKRYYLENCRELEIENVGIDGILAMMAGGEKDEVSA